MIRRIFCIPDKNVFALLLAGWMLTAVSGCDLLSNDDGSSACAAANLDSEWEQLGLRGKTVSEIAVHPQKPNVLYANSDLSTPSLFKTTDGGQTWKPVLGETAVSVIQFAPSNPDVLYAGGGNLLKSTDGGETWTRLNIDLGQLMTVVSLAVDPENPEIVYVGTVGPYSGNLYESTDGGRQWRRVTADVPKIENVTAIVIDQENPSVLYAGAAGRVFKSTDQGQTWSLSLEGVGDGTNDLLIDPQNARVLYAGLSDRPLMRSTNAGKTWQSVEDGSNNLRTLKIVKEENVLISIAQQREQQGDGGIYLRTENDNSWTKIGIPDFDKSYYYSDLEITSQGDLYVGVKGGIYHLDLKENQCL